jgi:hypothetical protein
MGCGWFVLAMIVRGLVAFRYFPRTILGGVAVGAVVGLIVALVEGNWFSLVNGLVFGLIGGLVFELIIRLIVRIENKRRRSVH